MDNFSDNTVPEDFVCELPASRFTMDQTAAEQYLEFITKYPIQKQVCICGHTVNAHKFSSTRGYSCRPGNIWCWCTKPDAVYFASNARFFMRATHGMGVKHALGLGIAAMLKAGHSGEWLVEPKCAVIDCSEFETTVACVDPNNRVVASSTKTSVFLCHKHASELGGLFF